MEKTKRESEERDKGEREITERERWGERNARGVDIIILQYIYI